MPIKKITTKSGSTYLVDEAQKVVTRISEIPVADRFTEEFVHAIINRTECAYVGEIKKGHAFFFTTLEGVRITSTAIETIEVL